jgi:hypothetical protein
MSLVEQFAAAAASAATYATINTLSAELWRAHGAAVIGDDDAQRVAETLHARRRSIGARSAQTASTAFSGQPRRSPPRSPDREASIRRRRAAAASGAVPAKIAAAFTTAEVAVLATVAGEVRRAGTCSWPIDRIAAVAGVCRRTVQTAIRHAEQIGLIAVKARPRPGQKSLPNVLSIISAAWRSWLAIGCKNLHATDNKNLSRLFTTENASLIADQTGEGNIQVNARRRSSNAPRGGMSQD